MAYFDIAMASHRMNEQEEKYLANSGKPIYYKLMLKSFYNMVMLVLTLIIKLIDCLQCLF